MLKISQRYPPIFEIFNSQDQEWKFNKITKKEAKQLFQNVMNWNNSVHEVLTEAISSI